MPSILSIKSISAFTSHNREQKSANATVTELRPTASRNKSSMDHIKRPNLPGLGKKHSSDKKEKSKSRSHDRAGSKSGRNEARPQSALAKPVALNLVVESPPAVFIDSPSTSSGHLLSGRLQVTPTSKDVAIQRIVMFLEATNSTTRPVGERCRECTQQVKDLYEWNFFTQPKTFVMSKGMQELPFSHLIPGHLPATTKGRLGAVDYSLHVRAYAADGVETEYRQALILKRALRAGPDKQSVRVFPPTNLTLHVTLPSVVHPIGGFPVYCRMTGIISKKDDVQTRWRLRKLTWRIEEHETMVTPACPKHWDKVGGEGRGMQNDTYRDVGVDDLRGPFKTDLDDGLVEGEFECSMDSNTKPQCDVDSKNGISMSHTLVLELVIAEEWAPNKKPQNATPTGAARVLRTQFNLTVTERLGMGISWDDEQPPMYEDVPDSPPHYATDETRIENYEGDDLHTDIDQLRLEN